MKKILALIIFLTGCCSPLAAQEETTAPVRSERFGLGVIFNDQAPLGARIWFGPKVGMDIAIGLKARRVDDLTDSIQPPTRRVALVDLDFDMGIPVKILKYERVNFLLRPGFALRTRPDFVTDKSDPSIRSIETGVELEFNGSAGFEYHPVKKASFSLMLGFAVVAERPSGSDNSILRFQTFPSRKGANFAFRYYIL